MTDRSEVLVLGGGVIGLLVSLRLCDEGLGVLLVDKDEPGEGTSYGNAGAIGDYSIFPVATPYIWGDLTKILFSRDSVVSFRWRRIVGVLPWLLEFVGETRRSRYENNVKKLMSLTAGARELWQGVIDEVGASDLLNDSGFIYGFLDEASEREGMRQYSERKKFGWDKINGHKQHRIGGEELSELEPNLMGMSRGGVYFEGVCSIRDPGELMKRIYEHLILRGVKFRRGVVKEILPELGGGARVILKEGDEILSDRLVLSAGLGSRDLARRLGDNHRLISERGYHIEFDGAGDLLNRPVCCGSRGFYMSPMRGRLRVAGTVELGGEDNNQSSNRLDNLERGVRTVLSNLGEVSRTWLGHRPSLPNSIPEIRTSRASKDIVYGFGHGHLGITMAPMTSRMILDLLFRND